MRGGREGTRGGGGEVAREKVREEGIEEFRCLFFFIEIIMSRG